MVLTYAEHIYIYSYTDSCWGAKEDSCSSIFDFWLPIVCMTIKFIRICPASGSLHLSLLPEETTTLLFQCWEESLGEIQDTAVKITSFRGSMNTLVFPQKCWRKKWSQYLGVFVQKRSASTLAFLVVFTQLRIHIEMWMCAYTTRNQTEKLNK